MSDNHGNSLAAWAAVSIATLGFLIAGIGLMLYSWPMFWIGAAFEPIAVVVGLVLSRMGHGSATSHSATNH